MVSKYKIKPSKRSWVDGDMALAVKEVVDGKACKSVSIKFGIPRSSLRRRVQLELTKKSFHAQTTAEKKCNSSGFKKVFSDDQEKALFQYITDMESRLLGLTGKEVRRLAYQFAVKLNIKQNFNDKTKMAGKDWMRSFMHRNNLSFRKSEHTSRARANGFNKKSVTEFYKLLKEVKARHNFHAEDIYNVDETGISIVPKCSSTIVSLKGRRQVGSLTAAERGELVTAEICMSATGKYMPSLLIFPRVRPSDEYLVGAPKDAKADFSRNGYMTAELFLKWFKDFIEFSGASKSKAVLLILDGHASHVKNLDVIDLANENGVVILCLPPHCSHKLQPLDVSFMKPLSNFFTEEVNLWQRSGHKITLKMIYYLFGRAFEKAAKVESAMNGFRKTGIHPFDPNVFKDDDFVQLVEEVGNTDMTEGSISDIIVYKKTVENIQKELDSVSAIHPLPQPLSLASPVSTNTSHQGEQPLKSSLNIPETLLEAKDFITKLTNIISSFIAHEQKDSSTQQNNLLVDNNNVATVPMPVQNLFQATTQDSNKKPQKRKGKTAIITDQSYRDELVAEKSGAFRKTLPSKPKRPKLISIENIKPDNTFLTKNIQQKKLTKAVKNAEKEFINIRANTSNVQDLNNNSNIYNNQPIIIANDSLQTSFLDCLQPSNNLSITEEGHFMLDYQPDLNEPSQILQVISVPDNILINENGMYQIINNP